MCTEVWCIMLRGRLFTEGEAANHTCHGSDGFKEPWECRLRDTMPSKAVSRKHARSRVWKMILSWLSASVDDALVALNFSVATLFAVYIGIRCGSKQAVRRGKQLLNPSLTLGGRNFGFCDLLSKHRYARCVKGGSHHGLH